MRNEFGYDGVFVVGQGRVERCLGQFSELIARDPARMAVSDRERPCEDVRRSINLAAIGAIPRKFLGSVGLRNWILGGCALLSAGAAQGQAASEAVGKVGNWDVTVADKSRCMINRLYGNDVTAPPQGGLAIMYDPREKSLAFVWASIKPTYLPAEGDQDFGIAFVTGKSANVSWGHPSFNYKKRLTTYYFTHVFSGEAEVQRFLHDVASNDGVVFFSGTAPVVGFNLDAAGAVEKLRECASKIDGTP